MTTAARTPRRRASASRRSRRPAPRCTRRRRHTRASPPNALRRHSLLDGVEPDPVGITSWAQPWVPLWLEYEFVRRRAPRARRDRRLAPWHCRCELADPAARPRPPDALAVSGRVPLTTGPAEALAGGIARYVDRGGRARSQGRRRSRRRGQERTARARAARPDRSICSAPRSMACARRCSACRICSVRARDAAGAIAARRQRRLPRLVTAGALTLLRARVDRRVRPHARSRPGGRRRADTADDRPTRPRRCAGRRG